jgi:hypothetical protein
MRFIIDDGAFRGWDAPTFDLELSLAQFAQLLKFFRDEQVTVGILAGWGSFQVTESSDLAMLLTSNGSGIDKDLGRLLLGLLGKCKAWDDDPSIAVSDDDLRINGEHYKSLGIAYAVASIATKRGVGVLSLKHTGLSGLQQTHCNGIDCQVVFIAEVSDCRYFYRTLYELENVQEDDFFHLARTAFPDLCFVDSLRFSKFDGGYANRDAVVEHLSVLNDRFLLFFAADNGNSAELSAHLGIAVSIEGSTRSSEHLMAMRDAIFEGRVYRCEWHSKLEPHRNRIHFHPGDDSTSGKIVIGIFVEHLPT